MRLVAPLLTVLLLSACVPSGQTYHIVHRHTLLQGSADVIYAGCVRGVIRWHHATTGQWVALNEVALLCDDVQRSFETKTGEGDQT